MKTIDRKTINFNTDQAEELAAFLDEGTPEHRALEELVGEQLSSDSAELRALVMLGVDRVRSLLLERAYDQAVEAGDFDGTNEWLRETTRARQARRDEA